MNEMDYRAAVNPTYLTAQQTLFMLAGAGNEDAKRFIAELGISNDFQKNRSSVKDEKPLFTEEEGKLLMAGVILVIEGRYNAVSRELVNGSYKNMLDIACGYTPRSLFCYNAGIDYVGVDVPVVAEKLSVLDEKLYAGKNHPSYIGGDATNAASLMAAADLMEGELFISSEGLTQYFSRDEMMQFTSAIREVLKKHGGAWYSTDFGVEYELFGTCLLDSEDARERFIESRKQSMKASDVYNTGVTSDKMKEFLETRGFKLERIPIFTPGVDKLNMLYAVPEGKRDRILKLLDESSIYKMTPDPDYKEEDIIKGASKVDNLEIDYLLDRDRMNCIVSGRIDTISAPALLEVFDKNFDAVKSIVVDGANLEYISSAGLRVLLMAVKKLGQGNVKVINASDVVKEIFETTGFDQMIDVE